MTGGLKKTASRLAIAAMFCVTGMALHGAKPAYAADLGGDCCADLEERIAELEATTVRKGNKKVSVKLYGRVNTLVNFWDDGAERNTYVENNSYSSRRFGIEGKAKISGEWLAGYRFEIEDQTALSKEVDQIDDDAIFGGLNVRRSAMFVGNENYGTVWWGLWSTAKDDIAKDTVVIKGIDQTMHQDFYLNWDMFLRPKGFNRELGPGATVAGATPLRYRDIARCYSTSSSSFDCSTRRNEVRYDTPDWWGFVGSWAWGEDDIWSAALRYQKEWGENWKVGAGIAYEELRRRARECRRRRACRLQARHPGMGRISLDSAQPDGALGMGRLQQFRGQRLERFRRVHRDALAREDRVGHCRRPASRFLRARQDHDLGRLYQGGGWSRLQRDALSLSGPDCHGADPNRGDRFRAQQVVRGRRPGVRTRRR